MADDNGNMDHSYTLTAFQEACDDEHIVSMEEAEAHSKNPKPDRQHTPVKGPHSKKMKTNAHEEEISNSVLFSAIQNLTRKFDSQAEHFQAIEWQMRENTEAVVKIRDSVDAITLGFKSISEDVNKLKMEVANLRKENDALRETSLDHARYKRRWSLRLNGVPEKEGENIRDEVIKILTKIVPLSTDQLQNTVDTVHRLGQKTRADRARQIIMQFSMRTVRDQVWKMSKNSRICSEMKIRFREDFCKEDREAHARLWPKVEAARKRGLKAFLRDGYAVIDGRRVVE